MAYFRIDGRDEMTGAKRTLYFEADAAAQAQAYAVAWGVKNSVATPVEAKDLPPARLASPTPPEGSGIGEAWKTSPLLLRPVRTIALGVVTGLVLIALISLAFGVLDWLWAATLGSA